MDRPPASNENPTHLDLLETARALRRAMLDEDTDRVHRLLCRLRADLVDHVHGERRHLPSTGASVSSVVLVGQERLLELVDEVLLGVDRDAQACNCLLRSVEIDVALRRQVHLEARVLDRRPLVGSEGA